MASAHRLTPQWLALLDQARADGWEITRTARGHLKLTRPGSPPVIGSGNGGDFRAVRNFARDLRRAATNILTPRKGKG